MFYHKVSALGSACYALSLLSMTLGFQNPIIPGFNPDPDILRTGDDYFIVTSTFEFFPGIPIYHSKDLVNWTTIGHAYNRPSQLNMRGTAPSAGLWAPTLRYNKGYYYLSTTWYDIIQNPDNTTRIPRSMYVRTKDIFDETQWRHVDPFYIDQWGFDPDLFFDDDGKRITIDTGLHYYAIDAKRLAILMPVVKRKFSLYTAEIDIETGDSLTESVLNFNSPLEPNSRLAEGSHIYKFNGTYYLLVAEAGTNIGHRVTNYRSKVGPFGPWDPSPYNPLVYNGHNTSLPILSTGHGGIVETPQGDWYAVFLGTRPQNPENSSGRAQLGRETFMAPMKWLDDGWFTINDGKDITIDMPGLYNLEVPKVWKDEFKGGFADKNYYTVRTPRRDRHQRQHLQPERPRNRSMLLPQTKRNLHHLFDQLKFSPTSPRHEAGLTIYLSIFFHDEIGLTMNPSTNKTAIFTKTRTGDLAVENTTFVDLPDGTDEALLYIEARPDRYNFGYAIGTDAPKYITTVQNKWLASKIDGWSGNFVGTHFGFYATSNGLPMLQKAHFSHIQTERP
ncbi:glycoside hydrolase family 43 protein [Rhizoctonia solani]|uniref:Glycoside hydrolase family 43 protein n=1 Tax=Rhizoctonia solani TaxID=456999 RepID=A0A8H8SXM5_9AGAM|nr:glycoside hydrolase family 43 protein [Rhizoctonia solani]QRW21669.1 glycoside hydrolase family 43 protein [Rhizoctonia solani]